MGADRIVLQTIGTADRWSIVQERVHVDLIVKNTNAALKYEVIPSGGLIGKTDARREIVLVRRKDGIDPVSLNGQAFAGHKHRKILVGTMQGTNILISQAPV